MKENLAICTIKFKSFLYRIAFCFMLSCSFASCDYGVEQMFYRPNTVSSRATSLSLKTPPTSITSNDTESSYTVAVISDLHFGRDSEKSSDSHKDMEQKFYYWLSNLQAKDRPRFILCLGDVTQHGNTKEYVAYKNYVELLESLDTGCGKIKVFTAIGNHDILNNGARHFSDYVSDSTFYMFRTSMFSWYIIDSANGSLGNPQYDELISMLEKDPFPKIICSHYPLYAGGMMFCCFSNTSERNLLIHYFATSNVKAILVGHTHKKIFTDMGKFIEYNVASLLDKGEWGLLTVHEKLGFVTMNSLSWR